VADEELDVRVGSHRLHALRWGSVDAPLILGLPGLTGNAMHFDVLGRHLRSSLQLVALDLRGRGRSDITGPGTYGWERHARDVLAVAEQLGRDRFSLVGQSMGGSVAMKAAELDGDRVASTVLVDIAGRVDPGVGAVISSSLARLGRTFDSVDEYLEDVRAAGLIDEWNPHWDAAYRYDLVDVGGRVRSRTDVEAVAEDRAYTATQDPHARWRHLTMPTLLVRATREMRPGSGFVVPADEGDAFLRTVPAAEVVEVDANHLTVNAHPDAARAMGAFLRSTVTA
jgi:pimeloyl-ACP methyl ester carboxylesterase